MAFCLCNRFCVLMLFLCIDSVTFFRLHSFFCVCFMVNLLFDHYGKLMSWCLYCQFLVLFVCVVLVFKIILPYVFCFSSNIICSTLQLVLLLEFLLRQKGEKNAIALHLRDSILVKAASKYIVVSAYFSLTPPSCSSRSLFIHTVVSLDTHTWLCVCLLQDVRSCTTDVDYFLWPRSDIDRIQCLLSSRWKGEAAAFRPIMVRFSCHLS